MSRTRKKGRHTAHTHPVLGNGEDFPGQNFTADYGMKRGPVGWELTCSIQCGNKSVSELVETGKARYMLDFDCPSVPFSRIPIESATPAFKATIPHGDVCHTVSILAAVVATTNIGGYAPEGRNKAFKGHREILRNEFIAVDSRGRQEFSVNGGLRCLIRIRRAKDASQRLAQFHGEKDYFWITLAQRDYDQWSRVKADSPRTERDLLGPAFILPGLMEAIRTLDDNPDADWARSIRGIMLGKGVDPESDQPSKIAQILLDNPIARACTEASQPKETEK